MRLLFGFVLSVMALVACGGSADETPAVAPPTPVVAATPTPMPAQEEARLGPGGYGFDRSDPEGGVANIMEAFATDEATATCIFDAWGDVANLPPSELTPELMAYEICGTSILLMMTGRG